MENDDLARWQDTSAITEDQPLPTSKEPSAGTLDLRWFVSVMFVVALLGNLLLPICIGRFERFYSTYNVVLGETRLSEWIGGVLYGLKLGELLLLGVFLGLGNDFWAYRLVLTLVGSIMLSSAHIVGYWCASWSPPLFIAIICYLLSVSISGVFGVFAGTIGRCNHWGLVRVHRLSHEKESDSQFDTRLLFGVMIAVAICIPLLKATLSLSGVEDLPKSELVSVALWSLWLVVASTSFMTVQTVAFLVPRAKKTAIACAILVIVGPVLFQAVAQFILPVTINLEVVLITYTVVVGLVAPTSFVFVRLRQMGYQLRKAEQ